MEELTIDGKKYISSKKAATITGYAKDYVGQLCREGRVEARLVGRSWYVYEPSLELHRREDGRKSSGQSEVVEVSATERSDEQNEESQKIFEDTQKNEQGTVNIIESHQSDKSSIQAIWEPPTYLPEPPVVIPELIPSKREMSSSDHPADRISEMQLAWQEWFSERTVAPAPNRLGEAVEEESPELIRATVSSQEPLSKREVEDIPMRRVVSDISPVTPSPRSEKALSGDRGGELPLVERKTSSATPARTQRPHRTYVFQKALIIAGVVISLSVTLVATGIANSLHVTGLVASPLFLYLEGFTKLK